MPDVPFPPDEAFKPEDVKAMGKALEKASRALGIAADDLLVRRALGSRIIVAATTGVRDPDSLALHALKGLSIEPSDLARAGIGTSDAA